MRCVLDRFSSPSTGLLHQIRTIVTVPSCNGHAFTFVRVLLGCLLIAAASFKLYGLETSDIPRGWLAQPRVWVATVSWEVVLGLWLLYGAYQAGAWLAACCTFLAFAGVSAFLASTGVSACGCLGVVRSSPWTALAIDLAALTLLAATRPNLGGGSWRWLPVLAPAAVSALAVLGTLAGIGVWRYGSAHAALAHFRGESLRVSPDYVDFGSGSVGQTLDATVAVSNLTDQPVRLIGGTADCSCFVAAGLPLDIPPGKAGAVVVRLKVPAARSGKFERVASLWADPEQLQSVHFRLGCHIKE